MVASALEASDTADLADRTVTSLSGGELARVAFARILAQATGLMLLDEPTASLDLHHQELVMGLVRERARTGGAAVVVLHDLNLAAAHADRVAVLAAGRLIAVGLPADVLTAERLSLVYGHPIDVLAAPAHRRAADPAQSLSSVCGLGRSPADAIMQEVSHARRRRLERA